MVRDWRNVKMPFLIIFGVIASVLILFSYKNTMTTTNYLSIAKALVIKWESLRLNAYQDVGGLWTIGYGHLIKANEPYHPYGTQKTISIVEAVELLLKDMSSAIDCVNRKVKVPLTTNQRAALISFVFNVGCGAFSDSTMLRKINASDFSGASDEFDKWIYAKGKKIDGLANRRMNEKQIFNS